MSDNNDDPLQGDPFGSDWLIPQGPSGFQPSQPPTPQDPTTPPRPVEQPRPARQPTPPRPSPAPEASTPYVGPALPSPQPTPTPPSSTPPATQPSAPHSWETFPVHGQTQRSKQHRRAKPPVSQAASTTPTLSKATASSQTKVWVTGANAPGRSAPRRRKAGRRWMALPAVVVAVGLASGIALWNNVDHGPADPEFVSTLPGVVSAARNEADILVVELRTDLTEAEYADALARTRERNAVKNVATLKIGAMEWKAVQKSPETAKLAPLVKAIAASSALTRGRADSSQQGQYTITVSCDEQSCLAPARAVLAAVPSSLGSWTDLSLYGSSELQLNGRCLVSEITGFRDTLAALPATVTDFSARCYRNFLTPQVWVEGRDAVEPTRTMLLSQANEYAVTKVGVGWTDPASRQRRWLVEGSGDSASAHRLADQLAATGLTPNVIDTQLTKVVVTSDPVDFEQIRRGVQVLGAVPSLRDVKIQQPGRRGPVTLVTGSPQVIAAHLDDLARLSGAGLMPSFIPGHFLRLDGLEEQCGSHDLSCAEIAAAVVRMAGTVSPGGKPAFTLYAGFAHLELTVGQKASPPAGSKPGLAELVDEWNKIN